MLDKLTDSEPRPLEKFQQLLREMLRSDRADLDFGIYRIMNHRRDAMEEFIQTALPDRIETALKEEYEKKEQASNTLKDVARRVKETLGHKAVGSDGELAAEFREIPLGGEYLKARELAAGMGDPGDIEAEIYNHLYLFFSRYYQDGDFVSQRRYSKRHRYAIPYNGEEVHLHWANSDQYYVKTAERFHSYAWEAPGGIFVRFEIHDADIEHDNVKGDKRFFLPLADEVIWDAEERRVTIPFKYRPLTVLERKKYGKQDRIVTDAVSKIADRLAGLSPDLVALSERPHSDSVSHLERHLRRYTKRNTSDFFIHKDLKRFLLRELDFYLKSEVLNLDHMERVGESSAASWFQKMRLVKSIGSDIVDFLAQIEDFQKMLWEKRKFVAETHYCVAVGMIPDRFYRMIANNEAQWDEWRELLAVSSNEPVLSDENQDAASGRIALLKARPTLMVDTRHFDKEFTGGLLANFDNLDEATDGLLVHGENWQALNLLSETYSEDTKCIYIDPPYNTNASAILYKNGYKDSSWLSMMEDRLQISLRVLEEDGVLCSAIDDVEYSNLNKLLKSIFGHESSLGTAVVRSAPSGRTTPTGFSSTHEYALFFGKTPEAKVGKLRRTQKQLDRYKEEDAAGCFEWVVFRKHGGGNSYREKRPKLFYPLFVDSSGNIRIPAATWIEAKDEWRIDGGQRDGETIVWPINRSGEERTWKWGMDTAREKLSELCAKPNNLGEMDIYMKSRMKPGALSKTWWDDKKYSAAEHGTATLAKMFGDARGFPFPKSPHLVEDCLLSSGCDNESRVFDFFAGSGTTGHAVINLNREDGGRRKFILVEMGEYFDTVLLPRIKKVTYSPEWKEGRPKRVATGEEAKRGPQIVKYMRLESYEDTLDNIEFAGGAQMTLEGDYLLKYMLKWETRRSATLLNIEKLASPFRYVLRLRADGQTSTRTVDIPETFNYLLGLNIRSRRAYNDGNKRYLVYRGETRSGPDRLVAVIWRETAGWKKEDFERDKVFVKKHGLAAEANITYVNGDSLIPSARPVEGLFRDRMFHGTGA